MDALNNRFKIGLNEDSAIVSHHLHNEGTRFDDPFMERAIEILGWNKHTELDESTNYY